MKHINLNLMRKCNVKAALAILIFMLVGFSCAITVMAKDFINDQTFNFTSSNTGNTFYVDRYCQARLMTSFVAMDDARVENIKVEVWNTSGYKEQTLTIPTNKAQVQVFNIGSGYHYLKYYGRSNVNYSVRVKLYTWDY